jgi:hypothetical protein
MGELFWVTPSAEPFRFCLGILPKVNGKWEKCFTNNASSEWSASSPHRLVSRERAPCTNCTEGWAGRRAILDAAKNKNVLLLPWIEASSLSQTELSLPYKMFLFSCTHASGCTNVSECLPLNTADAKPSARHSVYTSYLYALVIHSCYLPFGTVMWYLYSTKSSICKHHSWLYELSLYRFLP